LVAKSAERFEKYICKLIYFYAVIYSRWNCDLRSYVQWKPSMYSSNIFCDLRKVRSWKIASSEMLRHATLVRTDVSEELSATIIRVTRIDELGTLAITSNRRRLRSPANRKRRQKRNQVSNEAVKYSLKFCRTWIREWQRWQSPVAIVRETYRPVLSSERASLTERNRNFQKIISVKEKENLVAGPRWWPDTSTDWPNDRRS
jgi:hypothetical protein